MSRNGSLNVAVVGATGAVGGVLLRVLEERAFPVGRLIPLASERSAGARVAFAGRSLEVGTLAARAFDGVDVVFFAATGELSRQWAPEAAARGALVIDKSGTWRMHADVPLVVPEVNGEQVCSASRGIVASPNCTTVGVVMALEPLRRAAGLASVVATTFQSASGAGQAGADELCEQLRACAGAAPAPRVFAAPLAHNVVPLCETLGPGGESSEERKLREETRKILSAPQLAISTLCTRVPVAVGHSAGLLVETERPLDPEGARRALAGFPGVELLDEMCELPTPLGVAGRDVVQVGRVRCEPEGRRLWLWEVSDNLRKGAATNAVQIAEAACAAGML
jgi:aspartate-semialdehyde dehydrogenase